MILEYITWNLDPVAFRLFSLDVRWYGICWAVGFAIGYYIMNRVYKKEKMPEGTLDTLLFYMLIFTVVGARLGHCLFYQPEEYLAEPWRMLYVWEGGLASHGGAIGILLGLWLYARRFNGPKTKKEKGEKSHITYIWMLDRIVIPVCIVGALIRFGNICNSEIYGKPTNLPWGVVFLRGSEQFCGTVENYTPCTSASCCPPSQWLPCHPTGVYEALFCLLAMAILLWMYKRNLGDERPGLMFGTFLVIIFGSRIAIEFLKNVQVDFERNMLFDMGQWLSVPFVLLGIGVIIWSLRKPHSNKL